MPLTSQESSRYARHLNLPEVGLEGQAKLKAARVLLIGGGGLGSPLSLYLAAAGVGCLGLVDFDVIDESNLQRQVLYGGQDLQRPKVEAARDRLKDLNPWVKVEGHQQAFDPQSGLELVQAYDCVVDGSDNFGTRYLVNDACVLAGKPNVYGSVSRFQGQISVFHPTAGGPCYRCLFPEPPPSGTAPSCAEGGVLGVLPGVVGTLQATETLKLILGVGRSLVGRLLLFDALKMQFRELAMARDPGCPVCGDQPSITELRDSVFSCSPEIQVSELSPTDFLCLWETQEHPLLLDVREEHEWENENLQKYGALSRPLSTLEQYLDDLKREADVVVHCQSGGRSRKACQMLSEAGFTRVRNLAGGLDRWKLEIG